MGLKSLYLEYDQRNSAERLNIIMAMFFSRMELIEVREQSTRALRKVFVLLSRDMAEGIQHLLTIRARAGMVNQQEPAANGTFGTHSTQPESPS